MNLFGEPLTPCSTAGMASTGYTRNHLCAHNNDDHGSHHVCLKHVNGNNGGPSFCQMTGQSEWCGTPGRCADGKPCPKDHWCVCEWAFADAVEKYGCDKVDIDPHATNILALEHYKNSNRPAAYDCLRKKKNSEHDTVRQSSESLQTVQPEALQRHSPMLCKSPFLLHPTAVLTP